MEDAKLCGSCDEHAEDQDYIDLEVNTGSNSTISNFHFKKSSPPQEAAKSEFEFQSFNNTNKDQITISSTAGELFYNGKLLPLYLPLRLQMLENLLLHQNPNKSLHVNKSSDDFEQSFRTPLMSQSCNVSEELNPKDYFFDYSKEDDSSKRSWTRKLKLIKYLSFSSNLNPSLYIKPLIINTKPECSSSNKYSNAAAASRDFRSRRCRKSFSGAIKRFFTTTKKSSAAAGSSSDGNQDDMNLLMRRRNVYPEVDENPIQAAIAHCKNSQHVQKSHSRKSTSLSEVGQERPALCRG